MDKSINSVLYYILYFFKKYNRYPKYLSHLRYSSNLLRKSPIFFKSPPIFFKSLPIFFKSFNSAHLYSPFLYIRPIH